MCFSFHAGYQISICHVKNEFEMILEVINRLIYLYYHHMNGLHKLLKKHISMTISKRTTSEF